MYGLETVAGRLLNGRRSRAVSSWNSSHDAARSCRDRNTLPPVAVTPLMSRIGLFLLAWLKRLRKSAAELAVLPRIKAKIPACLIAGRMRAQTR